MKRDNANLPKLSVTLTPFWEDDRVSAMKVHYIIEEPALGIGGQILKANLSTVTIPFCPVKDDVIVIKDEVGVLKTRTETENENFVETKKWLVERDTAGDVSVAYQILPREVPEDYTSSPYFDFRSEQGGANGAGVTFLLFPPDGKYNIDFKWDLSHLPDSCLGVWSLGEGHVQTELDANTLVFSYYAVGQIKAIKEDRFAFYWLSDPTFDLRDAAQTILKLYQYMAEFFKDEDSPYKVFVRKDPFEKSQGGTALKNSYMFGYSETSTPTVKELINLFSHEMVHNWPHLNHEQYGITTWYNEGTAEYYSVVLPYRAGIMSLEETRDQIQTRSDKYYGNPFRDLSSAEAAKIYWEDRRAQRIPYGRGFFYLANVDAKLRQASQGKRRVDDLVLEILQRTKNIEQPDNQDWLDLVCKALGEGALKDFEAMRDGELIIPHPACFGGVFDISETTIEPEDSKKPLTGFDWKIKNNIVDDPENLEI